MWRACHGTVYERLIYRCEYQVHDYRPNQIKLYSQGGYPNIGPIYAEIYGGPPYRFIVFLMPQLPARFDLTLPKLFLLRGLYVYMRGMMFFG
jgi:hypothetical protein